MEREAAWENLLKGWSILLKGDLSFYHFHGN